MIERPSRDHPQALRGSERREGELRIIFDLVQKNLCLGLISDEKVRSVNVEEDSSNVESHSNDVEMSWRAVEAGQRGLGEYSIGVECHSIKIERDSTGVESLSMDVG